jgi:hypothetical protein
MLAVISLCLRFGFTLPSCPLLQLVDSEVVMLSAHWEKKKTSLTELQEQLQQLPGLIADLESMVANLGKLDAYSYTSLLGMKTSSTILGVISELSKNSLNS